ncbi:MAG TPA: zinc ABC transporter substrate-binding protein [Pseudomonadales bacterium]
MKKSWLLLTASLLSSMALPAEAALKVLACEPEWASLTTELGGEWVDVSSATTAQQDPHRIQARPSLIAKTRNADLLVCTGLGLEAGWLPLLLQQSGNPRIQAGQPGYLSAGDAVPRLEIPTRLDRSAGDVHAAGNPHIQQDPRNIARVAEVLAKRLAVLDPQHAALYQHRYADFMARWNAAIKRWNTQAAPLQGMAVVSYHKDMEYLIHWLGMNKIGTLESGPGLEPSSAHLSALVQLLQQQPAKLILRTPYQNERASLWLEERSTARAVMPPFTVGGTPEATDLFSLFDDTLARLLGAAQ